MIQDTYREIRERERKANLNWFFNLISFLVPCIFILVSFAIQQVHPFGDRVMLTVDSYHQYAPYLIEVRNKIVNHRSFLYSFEGGLGTEFYAAFANYASSPLNIFSIFFTAKTMPVFIVFLCALRAGLSGLFMSWFLTANDGGRRDFITTAFACSYALCGWFCTYFWNIMWCDAVVVLPLIALGLRRLFTEGKMGLYTFSLAYCMISNFYTAFFLCIFLVFFAPIYCITILQTKKETIVEGRLGFKSVATNAMRFILCSLLAAGMAAIILLPTYSILQSTSATGDEFPKEYLLNSNMFDFLSRFMVAANPTIRDGLANVYCGLIPFLMLPLFFLAPKESGIKLREKIGYGFLLLLMYLSFSNKTLNFIWHGLHYPNQIPFRESFILSFLVIVVGLKTIRVIRLFKSSAIAALFIGSGIYLILFEKFGTGKDEMVQILVTILFLILESCVMKAVVEHKKHSNFYYEMLVACFMAAELFATSSISVGLVSMNEGFPLYSSYGRNYDVIKEHADELLDRPGHKLGERTEIYPNDICDIQSVYDLPGISVFSSTTRESVVKYIRNFGFHNNKINSFRSAGLTRVTASLLGVRNLVTSTDTDAVPPLFDLVKDSEDVDWYDNSDALSVAYIVDEKIIDYEPDSTNQDVFVKTNEWVKAMGAEADVYDQISAVIGDGDNMRMSSAINSVYTISVTDSSKPSSINITVDNATVGSDIYLYFDCSQSGTFKITTHNEDGSVKKENRGVSYRSNQIIPIGIYDGTPINCEMSFTQSPKGGIKLYAYELNQEAYANMIDLLSSEQLDVTYMDDRTITGNITSDGGLLLYTVAYADGFKIIVDGNEVEPVSIQDALIAVELEAGTHEVTLTYVPDKFDLATKISLISLGVFLLILISRKVLEMTGNSSSESKRTNEQNEQAVLSGSDSNMNNSDSEVQGYEDL